LLNYVFGHGDMWDVFSVTRWPVHSQEEILWPYAIFLTLFLMLPRLSQSCTISLLKLLDGHQMLKPDASDDQAAC